MEICTLLSFRSHSDVIPPSIQAKTSQKSLLLDIPETVEIDQANCRDLEAEAFLNQFVTVN